MTNRLCYVCEGGDCTEKGSGDLFDKLRDLVRQFDPREETIKIRRYPCFGACDQGINVTLYPDKIFYSRVTAADLPEIAAHIQGKGTPVARLTGKCQPDVEQIIWDMLDSPYLTAALVAHDDSDSNDPPMVSAGCGVDSAGGDWQSRMRG